MINRRSILAGAVALPALWLATGPASAASPEVFTRDGAAIGGYDPVAYFTKGKPVKGDAAHSVTWKGAEWRFATAENKASFEADPAAYAPQYGGYCAFAVSRGYTAKTEPDAFTVHEGKLYLNFDKGVRRRWERDVPGNISKGDANWPTVLGD